MKLEDVSDKDIELAFAEIPAEDISRYRAFCKRTGRTGPFKRIAVGLHLERMEIQRNLGAVIKNIVGV